MLRGQPGPGFDHIAMNLHDPQRISAAARLDRLPVFSFHRQMMWLLSFCFFFELGNNMEALAKLVHRKHSKHFRRILVEMAAYAIYAAARSEEK